MPDLRVTPARPDLADARLKEAVSAERYVEGVARSVVADVADLRRAPASDAMLVSQGLFGERFTVFEEKDGWAWGQLETDGYVGYAPASALGAALAPPTHAVRALRTFVFPEPDIKTPPLRALSMNAQVRACDLDEKFVALETGGFVPLRHLSALQAFETDYAGIAERFLETPYLWGGRSSLGLDCSALVQIALGRCGIAAPRDSDMQERALGAPVAFSEGAPLERGDLVFWKGHVGLMLDAERFLHANATYMEVSVNPLRDYAALVAEAAGPVTSVRRLNETADA